KAAAVIAMEVLVKEHEISPVRVGSVALLVTMDWTAARFIPQEQAAQAFRKFAGHVIEVHQVAGTGGELDLEVVPEVIIELLQGLDEEIVHGKPDRPSPVRVPTKQNRL